MRSVGFWSSEMYDFTPDARPDSTLKLAKNSQSKQILIIARDHYHETVRDYAVGDAKDLKHILSQQLTDSPYVGDRYTVIDRLNQSSHRVTSWIFNESVFENLPSRPWLILPESVCVRELFSSKAVLTNRLKRSVLTVDGSSGLFSTVFSPADEIQSVQYVQTITGVDSKHWLKVDAEDFSQHMCAGLIEALLKYPLRFLVPFKFNSAQFFPWKTSIKLISAIFTVYTIGVFLYLSLSLNLVDYRLSELKAPAQQSVALRRIISDKMQVLEAYNKIFIDISPNWIFWDLFLDLKKQGVQLTRVNGNDQVIVIYGLAKRASEVLGSLSVDARVASAEYVNSVREKGGSEQFSIKILLKNELTKPENVYFLQNNLTSDQSAISQESPTK
jgi:hypothetical protein